ncbi:uncharacterized protein STEHIDRAFT_120904 [Stereum hirsutum FP-91666 SS1]|uniref:uncharacterized protein n=1 Tax=Stereum hirsutum (strain FP-91666) TaxID=721885 RepID=UPI000440C150|nr:uncharacterized protein STEHIDRAFT_120904 [Stereum hirsutum FP-91666 SS1]EIM87204.1 hypothetical protein STEHIDRAFT_120904 [Stereum hirsutum FP-91666 SS1]
MPYLSLKAVGSTARDFCMLERNYLSHIRLALLLVLISAAVLLQTRLSGPDEDSEFRPGKSIALASLEVVAALVVVAGGFWQYDSCLRDMRARRAFLNSTTPHLAVMTVVSAVVFVTCVVLLADDGDIGQYIATN